MTLYMSEYMISHFQSAKHTKHEFFLGRFKLDEELFAASFFLVYTWVSTCMKYMYMYVYVCMYVYARTASDQHM